MSGVKDYEEIYNNKIQKLLNNNSDKEYLEGFYYYIVNSKVNSISSQYNYLLAVLRFINCRNKNIEELLLDDYNIYLGKLKNKTSSYQITQYAALKKFSTYLYATKRNNDNPMQYISRPKYIESIETNNKRENGFLTKTEAKKYIKNVEDGTGTKRSLSRQKEWRERDVCIIKLFLVTGMRCAGIYKLDVNNIDFENNKIKTVEKGGKIKESYLSYEIIDVLKEWINKREIILNGIKCDALFISNRKERLSQKGIADIVAKYSNCIKNKHITPHKLRATYGTLLYNQTKDIKFVQTCMGHNSSHTTELYIRGKNNEQKEAANIMATII